MPDNPQPPQPENPPGQHIGTVGLLADCLSRQRPGAGWGDAASALEEYVAQRLPPAGFSTSWKRRRRVLNDLHTVLNRIWQRYFEDHKERTIPF
ncbi:MAG: hypothetical protein M9927_08750 [Anaerolineae bacterium]|nr:hypothetical protein [Anaerolineae bacterium]